MYTRNLFKCKQLHVKLKRKMCIKNKIWKILKDITFSCTTFNVEIFIDIFKNFNNNQKIRELPLEDKWYRLCATIELQNIAPMYIRWYEQNTEVFIKKIWRHTLVV